MLLTWTPQAVEDYLYWQHTDKRTVKRINELLRDAMRNPFEGLGKPEPLRFDLVGCWSRRINQEDRLVYKVDERSEDGNRLQAGNESGTADQHDHHSGRTEREGRILRDR